MIVLSDFQMPWAAGVLGLLSIACGRNGLPVPSAPPDASLSDGAAVASEGSAVGNVTAPDCVGCSFPAQVATECRAVPSIKIVYPPDGALLPPNLGTLSVQWVPHGAPFSSFEVVFSQSERAPFTDWRIVTTCGAETSDQEGARSGGCELNVDPDSWDALAKANRGGNPITVAVRGTTDGTCASTSENSVHVSLAEEDVPGTLFYWKSSLGALGLSGQVWAKKFGDTANAEADISSSLFEKPLCTGCHTVSRDGVRMLAYPADDTDPDYPGLEGRLVDLSGFPSKPAVVLAEGQPPGWSAFSTGVAPYLTSNGVPCIPDGSKLCPQSEDTTYPSAVALNAFSIWDGAAGAFVGSASTGPVNGRPTMPSFSADGTSIVYVQPAAIGSWDQSTHNDDDHVFGGSLFRADFAHDTLSAAVRIVASQGENNYYPSYSPDSPPSFVLFDRAPYDSSAGSLTGCIGAVPKATCPNDSFANPAARVMLVATADGALPVDLEKANGSAVSINARLSNSFPRFAPVVQRYKGRRLFWITFSSTRDYGVRLLNHKDGMYQCYPADSYEWPGSVHRNLTDKSCQHPQIWMAPVLGGDEPSFGDPSGVAFRVPYQEVNSHNHMAEWTSR
jgi:hypothetical protein